MIKLDFLDAWAQQLIRGCKYDEWTEIQEKAIPALTKPSVNRRDALMIAPTGSGKTLAYALPLLSDLNRQKQKIHSVILLPTRELAAQVHKQVSTFGDVLGVHAALVIGGVSILPQLKELERGVHVVVATCGRLAEIVDKEERPKIFMKFSRLRWLVLDEVDALLTRQSRMERIKTLLDNLINDNLVATVLASATTCKEVSELHDELRGDRPSLSFVVGATAAIPQEEISDVSDSQSDSDCAAVVQPLPVGTALAHVLACTSPTLKHYVLQLHSKERILAVHWLLQHHSVFRRSFISDKDAWERDRGITWDEGVRKVDRRKVQKRKVSQGIIFVATWREADMLGATLLNLGHLVSIVHGNLEWLTRDGELHRFKNIKSTILVATDVCSRGLDIPNVAWVLNYSFSIHPETEVPDVADYVHRAGRTGRAGRKGTVCSLLSWREDGLFIEKVEHSLAGAFIADELPRFNRSKFVLAADEVAKAEASARFSGSGAAVSLKRKNSPRLLEEMTSKRKKR